MRTKRVALAHSETEVPSMLELKNITWLGHDGFRIKAQGLTIYIDPYQLKGKPEPADLILITHEHYDHLSAEDLAKVRTDSTIIVAPPKAAQQLVGSVQTIRPGQNLNVRGVGIEAVPAYNTNKFRAPGQPFHPRQNQGVGYIITVDGTRIYHAGDTDFIPEMRNVRADVALLPVSGTYVMTAEEAAQAADAIRPQTAIPMHFGAIVGSEADAEQFRKLTKVPVQILTPQP